MANGPTAAAESLFRSLHQLAEAFYAQLPYIFISLVVLLASSLAAKIVKRLLQSVSLRLRLNPSLADVFSKLAVIAVWSVGFLSAGIVAFPDLTLSKVLTGLGLGSVAIGFAFKDIAENFLAGILILLRQPFRIGDIIECQGAEGEVQEITIRDTHLRLENNERIVMPNALLFKNPVRVKTHSTSRRSSVQLKVAADGPQAELEQALRGALQELDCVADEPPVKILPRELAGGSITYEIVFWTPVRPFEIADCHGQVLWRVQGVLHERGARLV